jgi:hypothetical protein
MVLGLRVQQRLDAWECLFVICHFSFFIYFSFVICPILIRRCDMRYDGLPYCYTGHTRCAPEPPAPQMTNDKWKMENDR